MVDPTAADSDADGEDEKQDCSAGDEPGQCISVDVLFRVRVFHGIYGWC